MFLCSGCFDDEDDVVVRFSVVVCFDELYRFECRSATSPVFQVSNRTLTGSTEINLSWTGIPVPVEWFFESFWHNILSPSRAIMITVGVGSSLSVPLLLR